IGGTYFGDDRFKADVCLSYLLIQTIIDFRTEVVYQGNSSSSSNVDRILYQPPLPADQVKPSTEFEYEGDICLEMYADRHFIFPLPSLHKICVVLMMVLPDMDSHFLIVPPYSVLGRVSSDNASCVALEALLMQSKPRQLKGIELVVKFSPSVGVPLIRSI
ncbi:hypothetical protein Tco_0909951, partial [Tanacetum coccineum]